MAAPTVTTTIGKLASAYPVGATPTRFYTSPQADKDHLGRKGVMEPSKIRIANNGGATTFGMWIGKVDEARGNNGTVAYPANTPLPAAGSAGSVVEIIAGDCLSNGGWIDVQSGNGAVAFQLFGSERIVDP